MGALASAGSITVIVNRLLDRDQIWRATPDMMVVGPRAYRAILWETEGSKAWIGRDRRRIKRERRRFIARGQA
jgi:hypothetical protein